MYIQSLANRIPDLLIKPTPTWIVKYESGDRYCMQDGEISYHEQNISFKPAEDVPSDMRVEYSMGINVNVGDQEVSC
jgi:hypothetical protein